MLGGGIGYGEFESKIRFSRSPSVSREPMEIEFAGNTVFWESRRGEHESGVQTAQNPIG